MYMCANACTIIGDRTSLNYCTSEGTWTIINMSSGYFNASELAVEPPRTRVTLIDRPEWFDQVRKHVYSHVPSVVPFHWAFYFISTNSTRILLLPFPFYSRDCTPILLCTPNSVVFSWWPLHSCVLSTPIFSHATDDSTPGM